MDEGAILHRNILLDPADDTARLVYADWLEEHGDEERAEFIRKQIRLMRMPGAIEFDAERHEVRHWLNCCIDNGAPALWLCQDLALQPFDWHWSGCEIETRIHTAERTYILSRGFLSRVELPCEDFLTHAAELFARHPITEVKLTDKRPYFTPSSTTEPIPPPADWDAMWVAGEQGEPWNLPLPVFDLLRREYFPFSEFGDAETPEDAAHNEASSACIAYGRKLASLSPLPIHEATPC